MSTETDYTIGEAAEILGVTTKTLRHWDTVGLLVPSWRSHAGYRLYSEQDLQRGFCILGYREAALPLGTIAEVLASPTSARDHLVAQRRLLRKRRADVDRMLTAIDTLIETMDSSGKEHTVSAQEMAEIFGPNWSTDYELEAERRWGETEAWTTATTRQSIYTKHDWQVFKNEHDEIVEELHRLSGADPHSDAVRAVVEKHRALLSRFYEVTPARQVILARMYVQDPRFAEAYEGTAEFLLRAVEAHAEGVDLANPSWG